MLFQFFFVIDASNFFVLQIIYLDYVDLNFGHPRHYTHDDRLPRILFVRTHHFEHVKKVDMDRNTTDGFGILPVCLIPSFFSPCFEGLYVTLLYCFCTLILTSLLF